MKVLLKKIINWFLNNVPYLALCSFITLIISEYLRVKLLPEVSVTSIENYLTYGAPFSFSELILFTIVAILITLIPASLAKKIKNTQIFLKVSLLAFSVIVVPVSLLLSLISGRISPLFLIFLGIGIFNFIAFIKLFICVASRWFFKTKDNDELSVAKLVLFWGILTAILGWIINK